MQYCMYFVVGIFTVTKSFESPSSMNRVRLFVLLISLNKPQGKQPGSGVEIKCIFMVVSRASNK